MQKVRWVEVPQEAKWLKPIELTSGRRRLVEAIQKAFADEIKSKLYPALQCDENGNVNIIMSDLETNEMILQALKVTEAKTETLTLPTEKGEVKITPFVDPRGIQSWSLQKGAIESACRAAAELIPEYDVGIGIAKKGLWLSFMFKLLGLQTYDVSIVRDGDQRVCAPMSELYKETLKDKRILVLENDAVTGKTLGTLLDLFDKTGIPYQHIDVLLISRYAHLQPAYVEQVRDKIAKGQYIGRDEERRFVVDTFSHIPARFRRKMALETDFKGRHKDMERLKERLKLR